MKKALIIVFVAASFFSKAQDNYFQQKVDYKIAVTLDDDDHKLLAEETFVYKNNSPDTLTFLWIHLWPNAYNNDKTALATQMVENGQTNLYYSKYTEKGNIASLSFTVDDVKSEYESHPEHDDIVKLLLPKPLLPGQKTTVSTPFTVKIPVGTFSRLGHIGQQYQITQWYPKPAVYDKNGWHEMPYLNQGEFYSEFGTFDVSITLPKNYVVGATGDLQNEEEIAWLNAKAEKTKQKETFTNNEFPPSSEEKKTLRYIQKNVHDFAWFADKRYNVTKDEVELPNSKRKVTTWSLFTDSEAELWKFSTQYTNDALYYYSLWNGDYPYNQMTVVDGALSAGGGMEYPNVTVIGKTNSAFFLEVVIMHEVGHNWFYGVLGSNEREHPWMDEGINSFNETRYLQTKYPDKNFLGQSEPTKGLKFLDMAHYGHTFDNYAGYLVNARKNLDQPIECPAHKYTQLNYGGIVYGKAALAFGYLYEYLGQETFDKCMQAYFEKWKFKHPQPEDIRAVFEKNTDKNLNWFFDDLMQTTKKVDYKIEKVKTTEGKYAVTVKNVGDIAGPYPISTVDNGKVTETVWVEGHEGDKTSTLVMNNASKIQIDVETIIPEVNRKNNNWKSNGLCKRTEPLRLQFMGSFENPNRTQLFFTPVVGYNFYDGLIGGVAFYNHVIPAKKMEFELVPMYGTASGKPVGTGNIKYNIYPKKTILQSIKIGVKGSHFSYNNSPLVESTFSRLAPYIEIEKKKKEARSPYEHKLIYESINITEDRTFFMPDGGELPDSKTSYYNQLIYRFNQRSTLNQLFSAVTLQHHQEFFKASLYIQKKLNYNKVKGITMRLFAGKFIYNTTENPLYNWRMDGQYGVFDYTYNHYFMGRSETSGVLARQFIDNHGAFKAPTGLGQSNDFLTALNLKAEIPIPVPIGLFYDFGLNGSGTFIYDAGAYIALYREVFEVYVPFFFSDNMREEQRVNGITFTENIRFTLKLKALNPFEFIDNFSL